MKLLKLSITNFKGIKHTELALNGQNATVYGANGTGKSTLADAFLWLLTGKDIEGAAAFSIKPLDENGEVIRGDKLVECVVEGDFQSATGDRFTLTRALEENWVQKKGDATADYKGDVTKALIDGVPKSVTEYSRFIEGRFGEERFVRLLTNTSYFTGQTKNADERRQLLFEVFGDISDEEIIATSEELKPLSDRLEGKTVSDFETVIKATRKRTLDELDKLPERIDEASLSVMSGLDEAQAKKLISTLGVEIAQLQHEIKNAGSDEATQSLNNELRQVRINKAVFEQEFENKKRSAELDYERLQQEEVSVLSEEVFQAQSDFDRTTSDIERGNARVEQLKAERAELVERWHRKDDEKFLADASCPTCKQSFPKEQMDELQANWNEEKANALAVINESGAKVKEDLEKCSSALETLEEKAISQTSLLVSKTNALTEAKAENAVSFEVPTADRVVYVAELAVFDSRIFELSSKVSDIEQNVDLTGTAENEAKLAVLISQQEEQQKIVAQAEVNKGAESRIEGYKSRQKELGGVRDDAEHMLFLCERFVRTKTAAISESINNKFQIVKFRLFEEQKNGGIKEVCEPMIDGKPYYDANRARQVAASLDIIDTFGKATDKSFPVFIDDYEGIFESYGVNLDAQKITLVATDTDKTLRVAVE